MLCESVSTGVSVWVCIVCECAHVCISVWTFGCSRKLLSMWEPCSLTFLGLSHMVVCRWQQHSPRGHRPQQRLSVHIWHLVRASSRPPWPVRGCYSPPTILQRKNSGLREGGSPSRCPTAAGGRWARSQKTSNAWALPHPLTHTGVGTFLWPQLPSQPEVKAALVGGGSSPLTLHPAHSIPGLQSTSPAVPLKLALEI